MKNRTQLSPLFLALLAVNLAMPASAQTQGQAAPATATTPYAIGAQRIGVSKCIGRINQITSFVTGANPNSGTVLNSPNSEVNQRIVSAVLEVEDKGITSFVSSSFAPGVGAADCSGTYDSVTYWNAPCAQVAVSFGAFKPTRPLFKNIQSLENGPQAKVFLMPAGAGCVSIKKEMLY
jgi:hypothetical protein